MDTKFSADVHAVPENVKQKQAMRLKNNLKLMWGKKWINYML